MSTRVCRGWVPACWRVCGHRTLCPADRWNGVLPWIVHPLPVSPPVGCRAQTGTQLLPLNVWRGAVGGRMSGCGSSPFLPLLKLRGLAPVTPQKPARSAGHLRCQGGLDGPQGDRSHGHHRARGVPGWAGLGLDRRHMLWAGDGCLHRGSAGAGMELPGCHLGASGSWWGKGGRPAGSRTGCRLLGSWARGWYLRPSVR